MFAFVLRARTPEVAMLPVAGRLLLERQLEWLYDTGVGKIFVELGQDEIDRQIASWLAHSPLGLRVRVLESVRPTGNLQHLAQAAGVPSDRVVIAVAGDSIGRTDLTSYFGDAAGGGVRLSLRTVGLGLHPAEVVISCADEHPTRCIVADGWGARITSATHALILSSALLDTRRKAICEPLAIPGVEVSPGVWIARGAWVEQRALLRGPLYVDEGAWIQGGAIVGPHCHVGRHAIVRAGAHASCAVIPDNAILSDDGSLEREGGPISPTPRPTKGLGYVLAAPFVAAAALTRRWTHAGGSQNENLDSGTP